jgi:hypothetical protein
MFCRARAFVAGDMEASAVFKMIGEHAVDVFFRPLAAAEKSYQSFVADALAAGGVQKLF